MAELDPNGQPLNRYFNHSRLNDRKVDELIGLCKGLIADGVVNQAEAEFIQSWLRNNKEVSNRPSDSNGTIFYAKLKKPYFALT
jgi:hypothetical protein